MLVKNDLLSIPYYKKTSYTGSLGDMRYKIMRNPENEDNFIIYTWKGPLAFDTTKEEKETFEVEFSDEGLQQITDILNTKAKTEAP
jgi:hypothetical protein